MTVISPVCRIGCRARVSRRARTQSSRSCISGLSTGACSWGGPPSRTCGTSSSSGNVPTGSAGMSRIGCTPCTSDSLPLRAQCARPLGLAYPRFRGQGNKGPAWCAMRRRMRTAAHFLHSSSIFRFRLFKASNILRAHRSVSRPAAAHQASPSPREDAGRCGEALGCVCARIRV